MLMSSVGPTIRDVPVSTLAEHPPAHTDPLVLPLIVTLHQIQKLTFVYNQSLIHSLLTRSYQTARMRCLLKEEHSRMVPDSEWGLFLLV